MHSPRQVHFSNNNLDLSEDWVQETTLDIKNSPNNNHDLADKFTSK